MHKPPSKSPEKQREYQQRHYRKHREQRLAASRAWSAANRERHLAARKRWNLANPEKVKQYSLNARPGRQEYKYKSRYGITTADKEEMLRQQAECCAICGLGGLNMTTGHVDHDHKTGKLRELLCRECNSLLGQAKDEIAILEKAISYLKKYQWVS